MQNAMQSNTKFMVTFTKHDAGEHSGRQNGANMCQTVSRRDGPSLYVTEVKNIIGGRREERLCVRKINGKLWMKKQQADKGQDDETGERGGEEEQVLLTAPTCFYGFIALSEETRNRRRDGARKREGGTVSEWAVKSHQNAWSIFLVVYFTNKSKMTWQTWSYGGTGNFHKCIKCLIAFCSLF